MREVAAMLADGEMLLKSSHFRIRDQAWWVAVCADQNPVQSRIQFSNFNPESIPESSSESGSESSSKPVIRRSGGQCVEIYVLDSSVCLVYIQAILYIYRLSILNWYPYFWDPHHIIHIQDPYTNVSEIKIQSQIVMFVKSINMRSMCPRSMVENQTREIDSYPSFSSSWLDRSVHVWNGDLSSHNVQQSGNPMTCLVTNHAPRNQWLKWRFIKHALLDIDNAVLNAWNW